MLEEILIAGFGGQGILYMGQFIAHAGLYEGKEVCWYPSYGAEMRGGTANCIVILSTEKVTSPILDEFDTVIALNRPSLERFEDRVKRNGLIIYNSSQIKEGTKRNDILAFGVEAEQIAQQIDHPKAVNMVLLGAYLGIKKVIKIKSAIKILNVLSLPKRRLSILLNEKALLKGYDLARNRSVKREFPQ